MPDLHKTHCLNAVKTVGGGLPPMAVGQSQIDQLIHRYRGQAPSHIRAYSACETYFDTGIANSAPCSMLSDQRCMIDFCLV
ncbi:hypothetical protein [Pseudomonas sp. 34 E 7]|nr:hypothetical protein [Pseudomonas sp. 34 E 7]